MVFLRTSPKVLLSMLLLLSVIPLFFAPKVNSQQYTTYTTFTTLTTSFATTFGTTTTATAWGGGFSVGSSGQISSRCNLRVVNIYGAIAGDMMTGTFRATNPSGQPAPITLYISNRQQAVAYLAAQFQYMQNPYQSPDPCTFAPEHLLEVDGVSSYSFKFAVPADGQYVLHFFNYNPANTAIISLMVYLEHGTTVSQNVTATQTLTYYQTFEVPFFQASASWLAPVALFAILVVLFLALRMRTGKHRRDRRRS